MMPLNGLERLEMRSYGELSICSAKFLKMFHYRNILMIMKKFLFGIIAVVIAVAVWMSLGKKETAADEPATKNSVDKVAKASLERVAEMVWALGLTDSIDEENPEELERWRDRCENAMLIYFDSVNPGNQLAKEKKTDSVLDEIETSIPEEDTNAGMIQHSLKLYSTLMLRVELYTRRILQSDSCFSEEIKAWNELYSSLGNFCIGVVHLEWFGGSGAKPMMGAARNDVLLARVKDLHRILQIGDGSDPASDEMVEHYHNSFLYSVDRIAGIVSSPAEMKEVYDERILEGYSEVYKTIIKCKKDISIALYKWIKTRVKYRGCNAIALDDLSEAVSVAGDESQYVGKDRACSYHRDEDQAVVAFSDLKDTLYSFPRVMMGGDYVIPSSVKYVEERAFEGCKHIESIVIPSSVNELGMAVFENCPKLERVYILARLDKMPFRGFNGCVALREIHLASTNPPAIEQLEETEEETIQFFFFGVDRKVCKIFVPKGSRWKYRKAYGWRTFKNIVEE